MRDDTIDYRRVFIDNAPLMDTRAPVEFAKGAFPTAINLPLMTDIERQKVGTCYKHKGQEAAIALGHQLVSGNVKDARIEAWAAFARANPTGFLYCFRGGLRSRITQEWLRTEAGIVYPRILGGYKAMRTFLIETLEQAVAQCDFVMLGGMTGTGKTDVLAPLMNAVDLERHANHRGSSFGKRATSQPPQISFENALAIDVLKRRNAGMNRFVIEDESHLIGSCALPPFLFEAMKGFPIVWLEDTQANRVERILRDYVEELHLEFVALHGEEEGFRLFSERMLKNLAAITRRLGGVRFAEIEALMKAAFALQARDGTIELHRAWIMRLLEDYYDPMYHYQRELKAERIVFSGTAEAVTEWLEARGSDA